MLTFSVNNNDIRVTVPDQLVSGTVGHKCMFEFDTSWDNYIKTAVFKCNDTVRTVLLDETGVCTIPHEVLASYNVELIAGVYGECGSDITPTIYITAGIIKHGTDITDDPSTIPTPTIYEQFMTQFMDLIGDPTSLSTLEKSNLVGAINELGLDIDNILPAIPEHPETMFLNGSREWSEIVVGSGSYSANINYTTIDSDVAGYKKISYINEPTETIIPTTISSGITLLREYLFDIQLGITTIDAGVWTFSYAAMVNNTSGTTKIRAEVFVRSIDGEENILFTDEGYNIDSTSFVTVMVNTIQPQFNVNSTDRLGIRVFGNTTRNSVTITTIIGGARTCYFSTPLALRHTQLRDLNGDTNYQHITSAEKVEFAAKQDALTAGVDYTTPAQVALKADKITTYTKQEVDAAFELKADKSNVYTKTDVDGALNFKADKATTYTKTEADTLLSARIEKTSIVNDLTTGGTTNVLSAEQGKALNTSMENSIIPILIRQCGGREAFKIFVQANAKSDTNNLTDIVDKFYKIAAKTIDKTYSTQFYKYTTSNSPLGTKMDDNATLTCTPSTIATPGTDDYADLTLFMVHDINYTIDAVTLEPIIIAIKDVYGSYSATPANSLVGVMQMTGWVRRTTTETTKKVEYRAQETEGFKPLPEAVRAADNSVRGFVIHAKYVAGYNSAGKLSSVSGAQPATLKPGSAGSTSISHDGQIAKWREWGNQYCGSALCDNAFLQLMLEIKYAKLGSAGVMKGCCAYLTSYAAAVSETGVKRILLTAAQASYFIVGSRVSLGTETDRTKTTCYDVCDIATIASIEDVTVESTAYKAVNLTTANTFNVTAATTYIMPQPWLTGSTDGIQGNDGSPYSNTNEKEPFKLQGIEVMLGMYEAMADITLYEDAVNGYMVYMNRRAANIASGNAGTNPVTLGTIAKEELAAWKYNAELSWAANSQEAYMIPTLFDGSSTTGYQSATYRDAMSTIGWREWLAFGGLYVGDSCGLACARLNNALATAGWSFGARACGSGANRGEYTAV